MPTYYQEGDAIRGEKIGYKCRKHVPHGLVKGSSNHKAQAGVLGNAYCFINRALRTVPPKK